MTKEYIDNLLELITEDLSEHEENPPKVRYNKNKKSISVVYNFNHGFIPKVKLIADRDIWLKWWHNFDKITFDNVKKYLSRPSKSLLNNLQEYAGNYPQDFLGDMFRCIDYALMEHPKHPPAAKPRKSSEYGLTWTEKNEVSSLSIRLLVYLEEISKQPQHKWPLHINRLRKTRSKTGNHSA